MFRKHSVFNASACLFVLFALHISLVGATDAQSTEAQSSVHWVSCATEGSDCRFGSNVRATDIVTVAFGNDQDQKYVYTLVSGSVESIQCSTTLMSDPDLAKPKSCSYTTSSVVGNPPRESSWKYWSADGAERELTVHNATRWLRYGSKDENKWYYTQVGGLPLNNKQLINCSIGGIASGFDPSPRKPKICEITKENAIEEIGWRVCSIEGWVCNMHPDGDSGLSLIAYGSEATGGFIHRYMLGSNILCNRDTFQADPSQGRAKECASYNLTLSPSSGVVSGAGWKLLASCNSTPTSGCTLGNTMLVGVSTTNTKTLTTGWSNTVTVSVKTSFKPEFLPNGLEITASDALQYSGSSAFATAVSKQVSTSNTANCTLASSPNGQNLELWQFVTVSNFPICDGSGSCTSTVYTEDMRCVVDPPAAYKGPACLPSKCSSKDSTCSICVK